MNAKTITVSDVKELILNGDFSAWTDDNPDNWSLWGEPEEGEISEVGTGEGHGGAGTGCCNVYSSSTNLGMRQIITLVVGRKYRLSVKVDKIVAVSIRCFDLESGSVNDMFTSVTLIAEITYTRTFVALRTSLELSIGSNTNCDVTIDNVSIKPVRQVLPL